MPQLAIQKPLEALECPCYLSKSHWRHSSALLGSSEATRSTRVPTLGFPEAIRGTGVPLLGFFKSIRGTGMPPLGFPEAT